MERYVIPSVMQALQLCQAIAESRSGLSASEIESALNLPRTSVFRLLRTLTSERVVEKRGTKYFYGTRIYEISAANSRSRYVQRIVAPELSKLIAPTNASAIICTLGDYCAFVIDVLDARDKQITTMLRATSCWHTTQSIKTWTTVITLLILMNIKPRNYEQQPAPEALPLATIYREM